MKRFFKILATVTAVVLLVLVVVFVVWANDASAADAVALQALSSNADVAVREESDWIVFTPVNTEPTIGFVFYPGGKVDYRAYAPAMNLIAAQGYFVALVPAPLNLAFFDINAASDVKAAHPEIENWFVGGHSLGGVAASVYASSNDVRGVVFWASYPADDALKVKSIPAISIYGTRDGLATGEQLDASRDLLMPDAQFIAIEGGNHAQFGSYGPQAGDSNAAISPEAQWQQAADATVTFFAQVVK